MIQVIGARWKRSRDKPAVLETEEGDKINCDTVIISTGGHRLAPGFQMRGYSIDERKSGQHTMLYVECNGAGW